MWLETPASKSSSSSKRKKGGNLLGGSGGLLKPKRSKVKKSPRKPSITFGRIQNTLMKLGLIDRDGRERFLGNTQVHYKTLNPEWNTSMVFHAPSKKARIRIVVMDRNTFKPDGFEGQITIPLFDLLDEKPRDVWISLRNLMDGACDQPTSINDTELPQSSLGRIRCLFHYVHGATEAYPLPIMTKWITRYEKLDELLLKAKGSTALLLILALACDPTSVDKFCGDLVSWFSIILKSSHALTDLNNLPPELAHLSALKGTSMLESLDVIVKGGSPAPSSPLRTPGRTHGHQSPIPGPFSGSTSTSQSANTSSFVDDFTKISIRSEANKAKSLETFFRTNTFVTRFLTKLSRGRSFVRKCLEKTFKDILVIDHEACEVNPELCTDPEKLASNQKRLLKYVSCLFDNTVAVLKSPSCPETIRLLCANLVRISEETIPGSRYTALAGFLFLRILNPCICAPQGHRAYKVSFPMSRDHRRTLILVAKVVQNLANFVEFQKEPYLKFANPYLKQKWPILKSTFDSVSKLKAHEKANKIVPRTLFKRNNYEIFQVRVNMHNHFLSILNRRQKYINFFVDPVICSCLQERITTPTTNPILNLIFDTHLGSGPSWLQQLFDDVATMISRWPSPPQPSRRLLHNISDAEIEEEHVVIIPDNQEMDIKKAMDLIGY